MLINARVLDICKLMMMDLKKYGLTVNMLATKIMPSLTPALANPTLNMDEVCLWMFVGLSSIHTFLLASFQFNDLVDLLTEMLTYIAKSQRNKLALEKPMPVRISQEM